MSESPSRLQSMIDEARAVVGNAIRSMPAVRGWEALQERDAEGNPRGPLPYTPRALAEFTTAHEQDPDDLGIVHDLAICQHARAWDLELQNSPQAGRAWVCALGYWYILAASKEFWEGLEAKLQACDPEADPATLDPLRDNLLENLLDIHVDFIRHYCELNAVDRATQHVQIVHRARIRPAVRKRLVERVFEAMTASVPESRAQQAHDSALTVVERFLKLFPDTISALRLHAELCEEWLETMSFRDDWQKIVDLGVRAERHARPLDRHAELDHEPLARSALAAEADKFALRAYDRACSLIKDNDLSRLGVGDRDAIRASAGFAEGWCRIGLPHGPDDSIVRQVLPNCLWIIAQCRLVELNDIDRSALVDDDDKLKTQVLICREAIASLDEASQLGPEEENLRQQAKSVREHLKELERNLRQRGLDDELGDW